MKRNQPAGTVPTAQRENADAERSEQGSRPIVILIVVVVVMLVAAVGIVSWQKYQRIVEARDCVAQAVELLQSAEDDIVIVDEAVRADVSSEIATSSLEASALVEEARADALAAASLIASALPELPEDEIAHARALKASAEARAEMMLYAPPILEANVKAARAIPPADDAISAITSAEDLIAKAATEFNKHTATGVKQSSTYLGQAETNLRAAESLLASAAAAFPEADFSAFVEYVKAKQELVASAQEIDALWLAGKITESNAKLAAYNKRDTEIAEMAKKLPESVRDPIADAYEALTQQAREAYFSARERALEADATSYSS